MADDGNDTIISVPPPSDKKIPHYHGDKTRVLFVAAAVLIIIAESTGANIPLSTFGAVTLAVILVIAAGITSPEQHGIHWFNAIIAALGTLVFGVAAVYHYRAGERFGSFLYIEILSLLFLTALYLSTRTIRGRRLPPPLPPGALS